MEILAAIIYGISYAVGGENALYVAVVISLAVIAILIYFIKYMGKSKFLKELVLFDKSTKERGYNSAENREYLLGKRGTVTGECRPAGTVLIDKKYIDAVTEGDYVKKGEIVEVVQVNGNRVVVRKVEDV